MAQRKKVVSAIVGEWPANLRGSVAEHPELWAGGVIPARNDPDPAAYAIARIKAGRRLRDMRLEWLSQFTERPEFVDVVTFLAAHGYSAYLPEQVRRAVVSGLVLHTDLAELGLYESRRGARR